jgi:hypothetical protein
MQWSRPVSAATQAVGYLSTDPTITACLVIQSAFKHSKDDIIIACNETPYLG